MLMKVQFSPESEFQASEKVYRGSCFTNSIVFMGGGNALNGVLFCSVHRVFGSGSVSEVAWVCLILCFLISDPDPHPSCGSGPSSKRAECHNDALNTSTFSILKCCIFSAKSCSYLLYLFIRVQWFWRSNKPQSIPDTALYAPFSEILSCPPPIRF